MRLNRLDLIRYGRFKDAAIDLARPADGVPDVTVIFGPNEAGKSTAFHAFLDLLFGFKGGAHPAAFRFERADLLVGAELDLPGRGPTVLRRTSKKAQSLLDAADRPLNDAILSGALHGLARDSYEERFSLDDRGLREGGARIAGAQGDLGQLLHAGLSGLTGMGRALDALDARADTFHKKRGRSTALKAGTDRLREIGRTLRATRLTTETERGLRQARARAAAGFTAADEALREALRRQAASRAAEVWAEQSQEIARLTAILADCPAGPDLPPGAAARVAGLVERIAAVSARAAEAEAEIARLDEIIEQTPADPRAERLTVALDRLDGLTVDGAPLIGRASTARADLDRRRGELAALARQIDLLRAALGATDAPAEALVLDPDALEDLTAAVAACTETAQAATAAEATVATARAQLGDAPAEPRDLAGVRRAFDAWAGVADASGPEAEERQAAARLTRAAAGLPARWPDLVAAGLPARETLEEAARRTAALRADLAAATAELATRAEERATAEAALAAQDGAPDAVDIGTTEDTRHARDRLWQRHRDALSEETAEAFAEAMQADDRARAHYLTGAEARQRRATAQTQVRTLTARHATAEARQRELAVQRDDLAARCGRLATALGLEPDTDPAALAARHAALMAAAAAQAERNTATAAREAAVARAAAALAALEAAAQAVALDPAPEQLRRALTLEDSDRRAWTKWQQDAQTVAGLEAARLQKVAAAAEARARFDRLMAGLPLPDRSVAAITTALPQLRRLHQVETEHRAMAARIVTLEQAIDALAQGAADLARIAGEDMAEGADPIAIIDGARARVQAADRRAERQAAAVTARAAALATRDRTAPDLSAAQADLAGCFAGQGAEELDPLARMQALEHRDGLRAAVAEADRARQAARAGVDGDLFAAELALMPDATRAGRLAQETQDAQEARDTARDAAREAARLYDDAFAAADRSDLATEQATLLAELRTGARQAAVARLGVLAARGALRRLAAERRSSMLRDVEEAFVTMTTPAWTGVDVWTQAEGDRLVGVQPDGSTVPVEQMSTGTMGQLYFALRIAGYRSFARDPGPLPMILDDIMETFDDTRARAALTLCARIGTQGQAILFTHHAHLVDLARETIPGVRIARMPD